MPYHNKLSAKIVSVDKIVRLINLERFYDRKIVFTNGCFDILHRGHVEYLAKARDLGNVLVLGLNTDASVKRQNKSPERPINNQETRATIIAALECVDFVVLFDEDTPYELIKLIQPDVLVKGSDYDATETNKASKKYIIGSDIVKDKGGKVVTIDLTEGFSTTGLIDKLKK
ncbi:MAG TPA: D-glycero-beta-D-manno-heptose 1-phosphate adenylyltransferase [Bacteroidia bacterium]|jgi:rfaE bifunctional protein nucleotidyltransferase chain/domain|nr:D-glycero-beta-D-manno-heptose 1-phosphate adenylyltransferase [Bacteroidia bacterium]